MCSKLYIIYLQFQNMKKMDVLAILMLILVMASRVEGKLSQNSLTARHSNAAMETDYTFQFKSTYSYESAAVRIGFPLEYDLSIFEQNLRCLISNSGQPNDFRETDCWVQPQIGLKNFYIVGEIVVKATNISSIEVYSILIQNVLNPSLQGVTSYFAVSLQVEGSVIERDTSFARMLISPLVTSSTSLASVTSDPLEQVVGQGSTLLITVPLSPFGSWYSDSELLSIRLTLPGKFSSVSPLCSIATNLTSYDMTFTPVSTTTFPARSSVIECLKIKSLSSYLSSNNSVALKIDTITNPLEAGLWTTGYLELVRSIHNQVVEIVPMESMTVLVQQFKGNVQQTNNFRNATIFYYFYLNHDVVLSDESELIVTIGNVSQWKIHEVSLVSGFTLPSTVEVEVSETSNFSVITISKYGNASREVQQCIGINLTSPIEVGYQTTVINARIKGKDVGIWEGEVYLNQTFGSSSLLSLSAVRPKTKLTVNSTGSIELLFFLNYQLPETQGLTNGSIIIEIYPQLAAPDPDVNGVLKCYFKAIFQASNCTFDNSDPTKTTITIVSPPLESFQYSQIPIILTTEGAIDEVNVGFPINPLVTRYNFNTSFYLYNSSTIPSEVYYSSWTADAAEIDSSTVQVTSLTHQTGEWTNVEVKLAMPVLNPLKIGAQLRLMVQFMSDPWTKINAWDAYLGYQKDKIYKEYPCLVRGLLGSKISCDLYTYSTTKGPYDMLHINSDISGSFFIVYGFMSTITTGTVVTLQLPKIKIGNTFNIPAWVKISVLQETPGEVEPFVEIYFKNITVFTTLPHCSIVPTVVPSSQGISIPVQSNIQYNISWSPTVFSSIQYIKYSIDSQYFPSFQTKNISCIAATCFSAGLPANWIVEQPATSITSLHLMETISTIITTIPFVSTPTQALPMHIYTYDGSGRTVDKVMMFLTYSQQSIVGYFDFIETTLYSGLSQWYSISFENSNTKVSNYPLIRVTLDSLMIYSDPVQCNSTTLQPYNETGIEYRLESTQVLAIWNIKTLTPGGTYQINCRMRTASTKLASPISPALDIEIHHNSTLSSHVTGTYGVMLRQAPATGFLAKPQTFTIKNPQILNKKARINYVGPLFLDFINSFDSIAFKNNTNLSINLKIILHNHRYNQAGWRTPQIDSDPPVCKVNTVRYSCSWTNNPLSVTITAPNVVIGENKIEITSEYVAPQNGVKYPGTAGLYLAELALVDSSGGQQAEHSFFIQILPHSLLHLEASSVVKDIDTESIYIVNFTIPTWHVLPNSHQHATNYSRIFVTFPSEVEGVQVFSPSLGGYKGDIDEKVGCSFILGASYIQALPSKVLECRLIPGAVHGGKVRIQVINHNGFTALRNSLALYIFKIFNPAQAINSFQLQIEIEQIQVSTGHVFPLYQDSYTIFLDPHSKNANPTEVLSVDDANTVSFFDSALDVGDYGSITLTAQTITSTTQISPYFVLFKLPSDLTPENNQIASAFSSCPFEICLTAPDINYVAVKTTSDPLTLKVNIKDYPLAASQQDTVFEGLVIEGGRVTGKIIYNITAGFRWKEIIGAMTFNSVQSYGLVQKLTQQKKDAEILVQFRTTNYIPAEGSLEVVFPSSVARVRPNCRSVTSLSSGLLSQAGASGEIGCDVQDQNHWVITSFQAVVPNTLIIIRGFIDLPSTAGSIGLGQIISYSQSDQTNIHGNGSIIDFVQADFGLSVSSSPAMHANPDIFMSQRDVLRAGTVGEFRMLFSSNYTFLTSHSMELSMYKNDIKGNSGGFSLSTRPKVCEFISLKDESKIGCVVMAQNETFIFRHEAIVYTLMAVEDLPANEAYELRLTSFDSVLPEGINFPSSPGTFKIDLLVNHTVATFLQQKYIQISGQPFSKLILTQFSFMQNTFSPFWLELSPSIDLEQDQQIIIEFPTRSNTDDPMFLVDLGWSEIEDGDWIPVDVFDCGLTNSFISCRLFKGDYSRGVSVKITCGNLAAPLLAGQTLKLAFSMTNPPLSSLLQIQATFPVFVYTYDPYLFSKPNYNTITVGTHLKNSNTNSTPSGYFQTTNNQQDMSNQALMFSNNNRAVLNVGDAYVVKFNFPIRVNTKVVGGCRNKLGTLVYGNAYYHEQIRTVVCLITNAAMPANAFPTVATIRLTGFYTPWYQLTLEQRRVEAIASYHLMVDSQNIRYFDLFPLFAPGSLFSSLLQFVPVVPHKIVCQRNDYIITLQLQTSATTSTNLQYTKQIVIKPDSTVVDYDFVNSDCVEHFSSEIEVVQCRVDEGMQEIVVTILQGVYTNDKKIAIETRGRAIRNPCVSFIGATNTQWTAYFLSSQNTTVTSSDISNAYLVINSLNAVTSSMGFTYQTAANVSGVYYPFDWFLVEEERYYNQFRQFKAGQYSPFAFEIYLTSAIVAPTAGTYNTITLIFGPDYTPCSSSSFMVEDLQIFTPICYLMNTRIQRCFINQTAHTASMEFDFPLPTNTRIHVYFSVEDPRNDDTNGYTYTGSDDISRVNITLETDSVALLFQSDQFQPYESQGGAVQTYPVLGIQKGTIDYATSQAGKYNVFDMHFQTTRSDIAALKFQIPTVDEYNQDIFGASYSSSFFNLADGDSYPCGNNQPGVTFTKQHKCYFFNGQHNNIGAPVQIVMTDLTQSSTFAINARILFLNPTIDGRWLSVNVKAYAGVQDQSSLYGHKAVGFWTFQNVFQVRAQTSYSYDSYNMPFFYVYQYITNNQQALWRDQTIWYLSPSIRYVSTMAAGDYTIMSFPLRDESLSATYNDQEICRLDFQKGLAGASETDDYMVLRSRAGTKKDQVYFIKKWVNTASVSIKYFMCKQYELDMEVQYSRGKYTTNSYLYPLRSCTGYSQYQSISNYVDSMRYMSPSRTRTLVEFDISTKVTGLSWDPATDYYLKVQLAGSWSPYPLTSVTSCRVAGGIIDQERVPTCTKLSNTLFLIGRFSEIIKNSRLNSYRVKLQVYHNTYNEQSYWGTTIDRLTWYGWGGYIHLYAGVVAMNNGWYVFETYLNFFYRAYRYYIASNVACWSSSTTAATPTFVPTYFNYKYMAPSLQVSLYDLSTNLARNILHLNLRITPTLTVSMAPTAGYVGGRFPRFRFYINNYHFTCTSFLNFTVTYRRTAGNIVISADHTLNSSMVTCSQDEFAIMYYYLPVNKTFGNIWSGYEGSTLDPGESFQFDIRVGISAEERLEDREWVAVTSYVDYYQWKWTPCVSGFNTYYYIMQNQYTVLFSEDWWHQQAELFSSVQLKPLTLNIDRPTEMRVLLNQAQIDIGPSKGRSLLLELSDSIVHFGYLNQTSAASQIQCICILSSSTTVLYPFCAYRPKSNMPAAVVIDLDIGTGLSATCYFPEWKLSSGGLYLTAKIVNDHGAGTSNDSDYTFFGGHFRTISDTLTLPSTLSTLGLALLKQVSNPALFSPQTPVRTYLDTYQLSLSFSSGSTQPIIYLDFQKGGIVPDSRFCLKTFFIQCRVYNTIRHILVAQYLASYTGNTNVSIDSSYLFHTLMPNYQESGSNAEYDILARVMDDGNANQYSHEGRLSRVKDNLALTGVEMWVMVEPTSGTRTEGRTTNLLLSFSLSNNTNPNQVSAHPIPSYISTRAYLQITCNSTVLSTARGCTVLSQQDPSFQFQCYISSNKITIRNQQLVDFTSGGIIQVVIGIVNPVQSVAFTLVGYDQVISASNYGLTFTAQATYETQPHPSGYALMDRSQLFMYPFFTKLRSDTASPIRVSFKLANILMGSLSYNFGQYLLFIDPTDLTSFSDFVCIIRAWTKEPWMNPQSPFKNSFRNQKQRTQHFLQYVFCEKRSGNQTAIFIDVPKNIGIDSNDFYYELAIHPVMTGTNEPGFANADVPWFKLMALPNSCEHIDQRYLYNKNAFNLTSIYVISKRPSSETSLLLNFDINFDSNYNYPQHYLEIVFKDLDLSAVGIDYRVPGSSVPCTLSASFADVAARVQTAHCVVTNLDTLIGTMMVRIVELGPFTSGSYVFTLDNFVLPDMVLPLSNSSPFRICMKYHLSSLNKHYEKCFGQLFIIDGVTNTQTVELVQSNMTVSNNTYGVQNVTADLTIADYPVNSSAQIHQKLVLKVTRGYNMTTAAPLVLKGYTPLWFNSEIGYYVYIQKTVLNGTSVIMSLQNLTNPELYQQYLFDTPHITTTFYDQYHPKTEISHLPLSFSSYTLGEPLIKAVSTLYYDDAKLSIPLGTKLIFKLEITVLQTLASMQKKQVQAVVITFDSNVTEISRCWVERKDVALAYQIQGECQTPSNNTIALFNFNSEDSLLVYVQMRLKGTIVNYTTSVFSSNGNLQYYSEGMQQFNDIDEDLELFSMLSFTENHYTKDYFEQHITQLTIAEKTRHLYFVLQIPKDLIYSLSTFTVSLGGLIFPTKTTEPRLLCEWMRVGEEERQYQAGKLSLCSYAAQKIVVQAPFGDLPRKVNGTIITYLLRVRELDAVGTSFNMPTVPTAQQLLLTHSDGTKLREDTLILYPYNSFPSGKVDLRISTKTTGQLGTYQIAFTPSSTVSVSKEAVLEITFDTRYFPWDMGMTDLFTNYGVDTKSREYIDNSGYNIAYKTLPVTWINGIPYSCWTSTSALPEQTCFHATESSLRAVLLLQTSFVANVPYIWKIPLLANPSLDFTTFRMNLTLSTYSVGAARPNKLYFTQIINPFFTISNYSSSLSYSFSSAALSNTVQSSSATLSIDFDFTFAPDSTTSLQLKLASRHYGIVDFPDFLTNSEPDSSFSFYFFQRINLLMTDKLVDDGSSAIDLGSLEKTNQFVQYFGFQWIKVHSLINETTVRNAGQLLAPLLPCEIGTVTWTVLEGFNSESFSEFLTQMAFTTPCEMPLNSTLVVEYNGSLLEEVRELRCESSFRSLGCFYSEGELKINIDQAIPQFAPITIEVYFQSANQSTLSSSLATYVYALPWDESTKVNVFQSNLTLPPVLPSFMVGGTNQDYVVVPIYQNTQMSLTGTIQPRYTPLSWIELTHPFSWSSNSHHSFKYQLNSSQLLDDSLDIAWMRTSQTYISPTRSRFSPYSAALLDYSFQPSKQYTFTLESTYDPLGLNNLTIGSSEFYYNFIYTTNQEIQYEEVYPQPRTDNLIIINPVLQISEPTALGFRFTIPTRSMKKGDVIEIYLDSNNLIRNMYGFTSLPLECAEGVKGVLTSRQDLVCDVKKYPSNGRPLVVRVYPDQVVSMNTQIEVWVSPVINPAAVMVAGAEVKVTTDCKGEQRCTIYAARGYFRTITSKTVTNYSVVGSTFTPSNLEVLKSSVSHTFTFNSRTLTGALLDYPQNYNYIMTHTCLFASGQCIVFPLQRRVIVLSSSPTSLSAFALANMTNGIHLNPVSQFINLTIFSSSNVDHYNTYHNNLTTIKTNYFTSTATQMAISSTQNNVFLRNYMNTAIFQLWGLFTNPYIHAFYLHAPKDIVSWDQTYCNASMTSPSNNPYPTRLNCQSLNDTTISITVPEGVNYYQTITDTYSITIHARFKIEDFWPGQDILYVSSPVTSGTFNAYGSYSAAKDDYHYYVTQAMNTITISELKVPQIGDIDLVKESYSLRLADINEKLQFDLLLDPTTDQPIKTIEIQLPDDFGYPGVGQHDACSMLTWSKESIPSCLQIRKNKKTYLEITPPSNYSNGPSLLHISNTNQSNLFTAPPLPGNWYNYTVSLYGYDGSLLQRQYSDNITDIGGLDLQRSTMTINNGRDALKDEIVDIEFQIGALPLYKGYDSALSQGEFYTEIHVVFENWHAFDNLLEEDNQNDTLVGCVTQGLPSSQEIKCFLQGGSDIEHEPTIKITNYDWVQQNTAIKISLSNIMQLNSTNRNTVFVAVLLKQMDNWRQGYLYNPQQLTLHQTSPLSTTTFLSISLGYLGINTVGEPASFQLTIQPRVDITSYFVVKFPYSFISNEYQLFDPQCSAADRVQIYYRSDVVRVYPLNGTHRAGIVESYLITGFPSSHYAFDFAIWPITVEAYSDRQIHNASINMDFHSYPCELNFKLITISSPYSYDQNADYTFELDASKISYLFKENSTMSLTMPQAYHSLYSPGVNCQVQSPLTCKVIQTHKLAIFNVSNSKKAIFKIKITLTGLTNPPADNYTFLLQSYEGQRLDNVECRGQTSFEFRTVKKTPCVLTASLSHITIGQNADYQFTVLCREVIRNQSDVKIALPQEYGINNPTGYYDCWSNNPFNILNSRCRLVYQDSTLYLLFEDLWVSSNQISIVLNARLKNPPFPRTLGFRGMLNLDDYLYSTTDPVQLTFSQKKVQNMSDVKITALPSAAGANSIYILAISAQYVSESLLLAFPYVFNIEQDISASLVWSNYSDQLSNLSYFQLLQKSYKTPVAFQLTTQSNMQPSLLLKNITKQPAAHWLFLLLKFIVNPSYYDPSYQFSLSSINMWHELVYSYVGKLDVEISPPAGGLHIVEIEVGDNDLAMLTEHNLTYRIDQPIFTNLTSLVLVPPKNNPIFALKLVNCCLYINSAAVECHQCNIGLHELQFIISTSNLSLRSDDYLMLSLESIFTQQKENQCSTLDDYQQSYFHLMVFKEGDYLTHQSILPSNDDFTPCQELKSVRGDVLVTVPNILYAGMSYKVKIGVSRPSKMVRVRLNSSSPDLYFTPEMVYVNNYDLTEVQITISVSPSAFPSMTYINTTHQQSIIYNIFRDNLPQLVQIRNDYTAYVEIDQTESCSVGRWIQVPVFLTQSPSANIYLNLKPVNSTVIQFQTNPVLLPAHSNASLFRFRYNGSIVPATLNISLSLQSSTLLKHKLQRNTIFLYFEVTPEFQTLPPVLKVKVLHQYQNNSNQAGRKVYNVDTAGILYDYLLPYIMQCEDVQINSTWATLRLFTRHEATIYYVLKERGYNVSDKELTSQQIRKHPEAQTIKTARNSSNYVNAYCLISFYRLQHQTIYYLYAMAYDSQGDSVDYITHTFMTTALSNAVELNLDFSSLITDRVYLVHRVSDVLDIDILRVKVVDSYIQVNNTYTKQNNFENQLSYRHRIVVSPSTIDDRIPPLALLTDKFINNEKNRKRLKDIMPEFVENIVARLDSDRIEDRPMNQLQLARPEIKDGPQILKISHYNMSFGVKLWKEGIIYAVAIEHGIIPTFSLKEVASEQTQFNYITNLTEEIPYSKQIILGLTSFNQKADVSLSNSTDSLGHANLSLGVLKPGTSYTLFITFSTQKIYQPILYAQTQKIAQLTFHTLDNPNIKNNTKKYVLQDLKDLDPELYEIAIRRMERQRYVQTIHLK